MKKIILSLLAVGTISTLFAQFTGTSPGGSTEQFLNSNATIGNHLTFNNSSAGVINWGGGGFGDLWFRRLNTQGTYGSGFNNLMVIKADGKVGIGVTAPGQKLEVSGTTKTTGFQMTNGATNGYYLKSDATGTATWSALPAETDPQVSSTNTNRVPKWNGTTLVDGIMTDIGTGVGVGTSMPVTTLHVAGNTLVTSSFSYPTQSAAYIRGNTLYSTTATPEYTWWNNDQTGLFHPADNVIGFTNAGTEVMRIHSNNFVGIGTNSPDARLVVSDGIDKIKFYANSWGDIQASGSLRPHFQHGHDFGIYKGTVGAGHVKFEILDNGDTKMCVDSGHVQVGDSTILSGIHTDFKLSVDGKIVSKAMVVTSLDWADYVFDENYKLLSLSEVESYYKTYKHLPAIPSENEITTRGIDIAEMNKLLMQKVEELTIYIVEQDKKITQMQKEMDQVKNQLGK